MQPQISIIVPIYNVEEFLPRCIESILNQTFTDFELILVDDGSPDNSGTVCDRYASNDKRIRAFHNHNMGAGAAREFGVEQAIGKWIMFVDGDDTIPSDTLELLLAEDNDKYDIISGSMYIEHMKKVCYNTVQGDLSNFEYIAALFKSEVNDGPCGKIIKRELFYQYNEKTNKKIIQNEDLLMLIRISKKANRVLINNDIICYNYIYRIGSAQSMVMPPVSWLQLFKTINYEISDILQNDTIREAFNIYLTRRLRLWNKHGIWVSPKVSQIDKILKDAKEFTFNKEIKRSLAILNSIPYQKAIYYYNKLVRAIKNIIKYMLRVLGMRK